MLNVRFGEAAEAVDRGADVWTDAWTLTFGITADAFTVLIDLELL